MRTLQVFSPNWIANSDIIVTSGEQSKTNICDRRAETQWVSSVGDDTVIEILEFDFKNNSGGSVLRALDRIIIINTNIKSMAASYKDQDGNWQAISTGTITGNTAVSLLIELPTPVTASAVKIFLYTTQTANSPKAIGELKICKSICELGAWIEFERTITSKSGDYYLANGALVSWREYSKTAGAFNLGRITKAQRDILWVALTTYPSLTYVLYSDYDLSDTYEFCVDGDISEDFNRVAERYSFKFRVKEL